ncbi:Hsp70 family protein [Actinokineospora sp. 24-640]
MPYVLGVDVGRTRGAAAVCRRDGPPVVVDADLPPLLALANGQMVVGADAAAVSAEWVAADLLDHVGDDVALLLGGVPYTAHDLLAALVAAVADRVADAEGGPPDRVAVTHPPDWGRYRRGLLRDALAAAGYPGVLLLPTVAAAAEAEHFRAPLRPGQSLGVALLGGRHTEYALLHRGPVAFDLVGHAAPADPAVGACLDDLLADLGGQAVKERLSTVAEVPVGESVVTQTAFADLARPVLTRAIDGFRTFLSAERPARAVVAGGTARVPLVACLAAALPTPSTIPDDPATLPARGAALAARPRLALPTPRAAASDPAFRPVGIEPGFRATASDPRLGPVGSVSGFGSGSYRPAEPGFRATASDPRLRPAGSGSGFRSESSGPGFRSTDVESGSRVTASDPRPRATGFGSPDSFDTVVSSPGFPPVRLPLDTEPPPRPPVEITPLEPPPRRFARVRKGKGAS